MKRENGKTLTGFKHGEIGLVDGQKLKVGRKLGDKATESFVDLGVGSTVPAGQDALLRRGQEELDKKEEKKTQKSMNGPRTLATEKMQIGEQENWLWQSGYRLLHGNLATWDTIPSAWTRAVCTR